MTLNSSQSKIRVSVPQAHTETKPIIKVRIIKDNPKPKAEADYDLVLEALARLTGNTKNLENLISNLSELISKLLKQQHYAAIRERERRW
jgi:hypothetical protein